MENQTQHQCKKSHLIRRLKSMLKKHQIKKIIKQMVPSSVYSNPQRKMLRETAKTELYDYITKYPDATYANLQQQFCDNEIINSKQMQTSKKITRSSQAAGRLGLKCRCAATDPE